jgi:hypothetical protein
MKGSVGVRGPSLHFHRSAANQAYSSAEILLRIAEGDPAMPLRLLAAATMSFGLAIASVADVNVVVTDGSGRFSEGKLEGYVVQARGETICQNPYAIGKYISCERSLAVAGQVWTAPPKQVWVDTNGVLGAMVVVDERGAALCESPSVSIQFRGPTSYILCE